MPQCDFAHVVNESESVHFVHVRTKKTHFHLTFTTLWAFSADDKLIFFLFFPENRI